MGLVEKMKLNENYIKYQEMIDISTVMKNQKDLVDIEVELKDKKYKL